MRWKKEQLLQRIDTLEKANELIRNIDLKALNSVNDILEDCQNAAIQIGNYLEEQGEQTALVVEMLEDYCESVYQQSVHIENINASRKISKKIQKQLNQIRNAIRYELPEDKKEVVFLPYKASMWDSLESVWKAADEDENCDAYVVPIPYFDKNPDGSVGKMYYEGDEYPDYVPITSWEEYDIKERRPDAIYIHNPYDNWNYVTSVHPLFYAENLKEYTDKLVYIPYFVLGEIEPDNQAAIEGMKHFCYLPGIIYADKVIVQSENMRQIYINEFVKAAQNHGLAVDRKSVEEKILGLGSPKFDKVLNTKKEDLYIPEEWLKVIRKPDGSWKKIIFYNTSVGALLQHDEKMLEKMEDVFRIFEEKKDEVALLWRPHPLIQSTIKTMRPELWQRYQMIVRRYKEEGWGIYDDTADLDRAVILSDAYYGDWSSVLNIYVKTGKLALVQNPELQ